MLQTLSEGVPQFVPGEDYLSEAALVEQPKLLVVNYVRLALQDRILRLVLRVVQVGHHLLDPDVRVDLTRRAAFYRLGADMHVEYLLLRLQVVFCDGAAQGRQPKFVVSALALALDEAHDVQPVHIVQFVVAEVERFNARTKVGLLRGGLLFLFGRSFFFVQARRLVIVLEWFFDRTFFSEKGRRCTRVRVADIVTLLLERLELLLLPASLRVDVCDHAVEQLAQVVILVQVAGVASEVPQVLAVTEPLAQDLPRVWRHAVVDQLERREQRVGLDLLANPLDNMLADLGVLTHCIFVKGILLGWTALICPII